MRESVTNRNVRNKTLHRVIALMSYLSQISVGLSLSTLNFHKFYHNFNTKPGRQRQPERQLIFFKGSIDLFDN